MEAVSPLWCVGPWSFSFRKWLCKWVWLCTFIDPSKPEAIPPSFTNMLLGGLGSWASVLSIQPRVVLIHPVAFLKEKERL